jgi:hypothetical protein
MPADVRPYLVPAADVVVWEPWYLLEAQDWMLLEGAVDGWDPGTDLQVRRRVKVDPERFYQETQLDLTDVVLTASWTSSTTDMTEASAPVGFDAEGVAVVQALLVGERLSGVLSLRTTVSVGRSGRRRGVGVASLAGSVLAEHTHTIVLENVSSMFPVCEIDFARTSLSPTAAWHLETSTTLLMPFYQVFRVLINTQDVELCAAVSRGARDKRQVALLDELQAGVAEVLLELGLHLRAELAGREEWPLDSVGDVLSRIVEASTLRLPAPPSSAELAEFRSRLSGAVRSLGRGRTFR